MVDLFFECIIMHNIKKTIQLFLYYMKWSVIDGGIIQLQLSYSLNVNIRLYCCNGISEMCVNSSYCHAVYVNNMVTHAPTLTHISVKREAHVSQLTSVLPGGSCIETGSFSLPVSATVIVPTTSKYWPRTAVQMLPDFLMCLGTRVTSQRTKTRTRPWERIAGTTKSPSARTHSHTDIVSAAYFLTVSKKRRRISLNATFTVRGGDTLK